MEVKPPVELLWRRCPYCKERVGIALYPTRPICTNHRSMRFLDEHELLPPDWGQLLKEKERSPESLFL